MDYNDFEISVNEEEYLKQSREWANTIINQFAIPSPMVGMQSKERENVDLRLKNYGKAIDAYHKTQKFSGHYEHLKPVSPQEEKERMALRMLDVLLQTAGYETCGNHHEKILIRDVETEKIHFFLPLWYMLSLEYEQLLYYVYVFLTDKAAFYDAEEGPFENHPF